MTVTFEGGGGTAFQPETQENVTVNLGVSSDLRFDVQTIAVAETVTVTATVDPVFSSSRTGAATSVDRSEIATLPTVTGPHQRHHPPDAAGQRQRRSPARTTG